MKKIILLLAVAAFVFSPLAVSTAQAGPGKHARIAKHMKHARHQAKHLKHHHAKHRTA
jgi:Ni/Co efflux regulator RcnB